MSKAKTPQEYYNECKEKGLDLPIEDYVNNRTKIKHKCSKGHTYKQIPRSHLQGHGCPYCVGTKKKTTLYYVTECKHRGYDQPIEDYKGNKVKIKHKCKRGHIYLQTPNNHLQGHGCPTCNKKLPYLAYSQEEYIRLAIKKSNAIPKEQYRGRMTKIKHKCLNCGNTYNQFPNDLLRNHIGCPYCYYHSNGEHYIESYLMNNYINYTPQKTFKDLKDKRNLSYDFYLPKYNILIEYQGIQHYELGHGYMNRNDRLEKQQLHDKMKREYAKKNGYKLLELHYSLDTQEKVNNYLDKHLK